MPKPVDRKPGKEDIIRWLILFCFVGALAELAVGMDYPYLILPPLMVTFVEMVNSKAGFRNRPTQVFLFLATSHSGYCTSNCRSPPSSSTGKYRCFNHCGYPIPHLRVDKEILCSCRSTGVHSYAITQRESGLVTFRGFYRSSLIHNHCHGCLSKML